MADKGASGTVPKRFGGHSDEINCAVFSVDFKWLVTGSDDSTVCFFDAVSGELLRRLAGHTGAVLAVSISPDGRYLASGSYDKSVRVWTTNDAQNLHTLLGHAKSVECVAFSQDSTALCSGSWDRTILLWNLLNGSVLYRFIGHEDSVQCLAFSLNGNFLASGSWDRSVRLWLVRGDVSSCKFEALLSRDESFVRRRQLLVLRGHKGNIRCVAFSSLGLLASCSWDKTVRVWQPWDGQCLHTLTGHRGWVQSIAFSPDGQQLTSAAEDDLVCVWSVGTGRCTSLIDQQQMSDNPGLVTKCAFGPRGIIVAFGTATFVKHTDAGNQAEASDSGDSDSD